MKLALALIALTVTAGIGTLNYCVAPTTTAPMTLATEIQHSTDGGDTWSDVTSSGSATGWVAEAADDRSQYYYVWLSTTEIYSVRKIDVSTADQPTFYNAFAANPSTDVTMTWTSAGRYSSVQ